MEHKDETHIVLSNTYNMDKLILLRKSLTEFKKQFKCMTRRLSQEALLPEDIV